MATFPVTVRYFISLRHSDVGLAGVMSFPYFKNSATLAAITPQPTFSELQNGRYYFDYTFATKSDPDVVFEVDAGPSIPTEEVRYANSQLSPRDRFIDEPISQVATDVWADAVSYSAGQKGKRVDQLGDPTDTSATATMFGKELLYKESVRGDGAGLTDGNSVKQAYDRIGSPLGGFSTIAAQLGDPSGTNSLAQDVIALQTGVTTSIADVAAVKVDTAAIKLKTDNLPSDPASNTVVNAARDNVKGAQLLDISQIAGGAAFVPATHNLKAIYDSVISGGSSPATIAAAVWDELLAGHLGVGKAGQALYDASVNTVDNAAIATAVWNKDVSAIVGAGLAGKQLNTAADQTGLVDLIYEEPTAGHLTVGTFGRLQSDSHGHALLARKVAMGKWKIQAFQLTLYDTDGITPVQVFNLLDDAAAPTNTKVYERDPTLPVI